MYFFICVSSLCLVISDRLSWLHVSFRARAAALYILLTVTDRIEMRAT